MSDSPSELGINVEFGGHSYFLIHKHPSFQPGINSLDDLKNYNNEFFEIMKGISKEMTVISPQGFTFEARNARDFLSRIAKFGHNLHKRFFPDEKTREILQSQLRLENTESNNHLIYNIIKINSIRSLPWDIFYDGDYNEIKSQKINPTSLWGMKYVTATDLGIESESDEWGEKQWYKIDNNKATSIGIIYDNELNGLDGVINPLFDNYIRELGHSVKNISPIYCSSRDMFGDELKKLNCNIIYIHCHAKTDFSNIRKSWIFDEDINLDTIECEWEIKTLKGKPFVFLNACESGQSNPLSDFGIVNMIYKMGARAIIAPHCEVPKTIAPEMARVFFSSFLSGKTIGESLMKTR